MCQLGDNKWPDGTRVMVRNKPKSWSEATIYTRLRYTARYGPGEVLLR